MDKEQQKQQLEADLKVKNQELEALKSNTLSSIEKKTEEEKINKEIEALKIQLEEVNKQIEASKQQTDELRTSIENQVSNTEWTYELIKGTNME
ncbi:hypothetical protein KKG31_01620 [Patescibacteria group bacterium]|nr:hypothetical protein [Patescibacteria group bacterium]